VIAPLLSTDAWKGWSVALRQKRINQENITMNISTNLKLGFWTLALTLLAAVACGQTPPGASLAIAMAVSPATGGTLIPADSAANSSSPAGGTLTPLGDIVIQEPLGGEQNFSPNQNNATFILTAPAGWQYQAGHGSVSAAPGGDITSATIVVGPSTVIVTLSTDGGNNLDTLTVSGLMAQAVDGANVPGAGDILWTAANPGTASIAGLTHTQTFGPLSQAVGALVHLVVTLQIQTFTDGTTLAGSGNSGVVAPQPAGVGFAISKLSAVDQFFNIVTSYAGTKTISYSGPGISPSGVAPSYRTSVIFIAGQSSSTLVTTLTRAETTTITATDTAPGGPSGPASSPLTVLPGPAAQIRVETLANGSGTVVPTQTLTAGVPLIVFGISRDSLGNFLANVAADSWSVTGTLAPGDLVPAGDMKSAALTGRCGTSGTIHVAKAGLASVNSGVLTVLGGGAPVITGCPANITVNTGPGRLTCDQVASWTPPTASDSCGVSLSSNHNPGDTFPVGTTTVIYTAMDPAGNTATCSFTVTVKDTTPPIVLTKNIAVNLDDTGHATITTADVDAGSRDACGAVSLSLDNTNFTCANLGANTVKLTATDSSGNSATATATVTVHDVTAPAVVTKNIDVNLDATGNATIAAADVDGGTTDACGPISLSLDQSSFTCANLGANTIKLTASDGSGNSASATAIVTIHDVTAPNVVTKNISVNLDATGNATIAPADVDGGTSDACGAVSLSLDQSSFTCANLGPNTVNLIATDSSGNTAAASATVSIHDVTAPTVVTKNIDVNLDATGNATIVPADVDGGTSDACGPVSLSLDQSHFSCANAGPNIVTLTATDSSGNSATATATVLVHGASAPSITAPADLTDVATDPGQCSTAKTNLNLGTPTLSESCGAATVHNDAPDSFPHGTTTVTWTVTDASGNQATATQRVTVQDHEAPSITCPPAVTVQCSDSILPANTGSATAADNCDASPALTYTDNVTPGLCPSTEQITRTWTVTDSAGNSSQCQQTITVVDTTPPILLGLPSATAGFECFADVPPPPAVTASDNCDPNVLVHFSETQSNPGSSCANTITRTWSATDCAGNPASFTQIITVDDTSQPAITLNGANSMIVLLNGSFTDPGFSTAPDPCGGAITPAVEGTVNVQAVGTYPVNYTATSTCGNTATARRAVSVRYQPAGGTCGGVPTHAILQPIDADGSSVFKQGSTVPAKFRVCDAQGTSVGPTASASTVVSNFRLIQVINGLVPTQVDEAVDSGTPDSAFRWDSTDQQWIFNISTKNLGANRTYVYQITLNDGTAIEFQFGLR
jgi:HYR domain-containing protein/surface protein with Ig-like domain